MEPTMTSAWSGTTKIYNFFFVLTIRYPATTLGPDYSGFRSGANKALPMRATPRELELGSKPNRAT